MQNWAKTRGSWGTNEHVEPNLNVVWPNAIVFNTLIQMEPGSQSSAQSEDGDEMAGRSPQVLESMICLSVPLS